MDTLETALKICSVAMKQIINHELSPASGKLDCDQHIFCAMHTR